MKKSKLLIACLLLPIFLSAQIDTLKLNRVFVKKSWNDTKRTFTAPAHWDGRDWTTFGAVAVSVVALSLVDEPMSDAFQGWHDDWGDSGEQFSSNFLEPWGAKYSLALIGGFMGYGLLAKDLKSQSTALLATESFLLASLVARVPKILVGRSRPNTDDLSPYKIGGPFQGSSFPSGHTTAVFAVASVIANQYADSPIVPIISYTLATAVGVSRIYDNRHWLSDVVAGAAIGIAVGNLVSAKNNKPKKVAIVPFSSGKFRGLKLAYTL